MLSIVSQPHFWRFTFILEQSIDVADLRSTSRILLNDIVPVVQYSDNTIRSIGEFAELSAASSVELWLIEPNIKIQLEANFTNSLIVASLGSIKSGLQLITNNAICFLHSSSDRLCVFIEILIGWFRFIQE